MKPDRPANRLCPAKPPPPPVDPVALSARLVAAFLKGKWLQPFFRVDKLSCRSRS
jgi:hypothetical protein